MAAKLLTDFINDFPKDPRICEALTLRGDMYAKTKKEAEALMDFDRVIARWPKAESAGRRMAESRSDLCGTPGYGEHGEVL